MNNDRQDKYRSFEKNITPKTQTQQRQRNEESKYSEAIEGATEASASPRCTARNFNPVVPRPRFIWKSHRAASLVYTSPSLFARNSGFHLAAGAKSRGRWNESEGLCTNSIRFHSMVDVTDVRATRRKTSSPVLLIVEPSCGVKCETRNERTPC